VFRILLALGLGVFIVTAFQLCQSLNSGGGNPPLPEEADVLLDHCGDWEDDWENTTSAPLVPPGGGFPSGAVGLRGSASSACTNFGGAFTQGSFSGSTDAGDFVEMAFTARREINMTGRQVYFRYDPWRMGGSNGLQFSSVGTQQGGVAQGTGPLFEFYTEQDGSTLFAAAIIYDFSGPIVNESVSISGYDPDGAHAWIRFRHDPATDVWGIDTAPFCGEWTEQVTAVITTRPSRQKLWLFSEAYPEGEAAPRFSAILGTVFTDVYPGGS